MSDLDLEYGFTEQDAEELMDSFELAMSKAVTIASLKKFGGLDGEG